MNRTCSIEATRSRSSCAEPHRVLVRGGERGAAAELRPDRLDDRGVRVAVDQRRVVVQQLDVAVPVDVGEARARALGRERRIGLEPGGRARVAAGHRARRLLVQPGRARGAGEVAIDDRGHAPSLAEGTLTGRGDCAMLETAPTLRHPIVTRSMHAQSLIAPPRAAAPRARPRTHQPPDAALLQHLQRSCGNQAVLRHLAVQRDTGSGSGSQTPPPAPAPQKPPPAPAPTIDLMLPEDRKPLSFPGEEVLFHARFLGVDGAFELAYTAVGGKFDSATGQAAKTVKDLDSGQRPVLHRRRVGWHVAGDGEARAEAQRRQLRRQPLGLELRQEDAGADDDHPGPARDRAAARDDVRLQARPPDRHGPGSPTTGTRRSSRPSPATRPATSRWPT